MKHLTILGSFLFIIALSLASTPPPHLDDGPTNHFHLYIWGYYNDLSAEHNVAKKCFDTIMRSGGSLYSYPGYIHNLFNTKQYEKIISMIPQIEANFPQQLDLQMIIIKALELSGKQSQADKRIMALADSHPEDAELVYYAAAAHVRARHPEQAVAIMDRYLKIRGEKSSSFIFYFLKAQICLQLMQKDAAVSNIHKCVELNPNFEQGWLLSGLINELTGNVDKAMASYRNFLSIVGHDANVERQILNLMLKKENAKLMPLNDSLFDRALDLYHQKEFLAALELINDHLLIHPFDENGRLFKIELLGSLKRSKEAITLLKNWIDENPNNPSWYRILHLMYMNKTEQRAVVATLKHYAHSNPSITYPFFYLIDIALKRNTLSEALYYLNRAIASSKDVLTKTQMLYQIALIYYERHQWPSMLETLSVARKINPDYAPLNHLLADYYLVKDKNFKAAQLHIDAALKKDPNNHLFLNTQAQIWYKEKKFYKAPDLIPLGNYQITKKLPKLKYVQKLTKKHKELSLS
ncbi:MAG TPA: tetratricopeptide repeat protein [Candidatus Babeliales bacterium]|nr:tetratricopeptide repeat protein [Candidatus Babeliales bacterium]